MTEDRIQSWYCISISIVFYCYELLMKLHTTKVYPYNKHKTRWITTLDQGGSHFPQWFVVSGATAKDSWVVENTHSFYYVVKCSHRTTRALDPLNRWRVSHCRTPCRIDEYNRHKHRDSLTRQLRKRRIKYENGVVKLPRGQLE